MQRIPTKFFGERECAPADIYHFPVGVPGFEDERAFVFLKVPGSEPLTFLQSVNTRNLCFVLLPVQAIDADYQLVLTEEELSELGLPAGDSPRIGRDVLCAVTVGLSDGESPTVNLMAPIVVNLRNNRGIQAIQGEAGYSHRHALNFGEIAGVAACS